MKMNIPQEIQTGVEDILKKLALYKKIELYKFIIGDPNDAHSKGYDDSRWSVSKEPIEYNRHQGATWFRFKVEVPEKILDIPVKGAVLRISSFFTAPIDTYVDGELKFSENTWMDFKNPEIILTDNAIPGQIFTIAAKLDLGEQCYSNGKFSMDFIVDRIEDIEFEISSFREELAYACRFSEVKEILPRVFELISECIRGKEGILTLIEKIRLSRELLKPMKTRAKQKTVHLIGHAHIDMNWFWSFEETCDVIGRDFGTMSRLMSEIPDFKFSQSQCATYDIAEKLYPGIFERIKKHIGSGNWDVTASTWVEGDLNMASGEAIVRHILYSKKYLKEKFGFDPRIMWCPDTFGHSGNIPQIARKSGIDYYYFSRCGKQNRENGSRVAYFIDYGAERPVFWWEGIDGSRILAFNSIYSSEMNAKSVLGISGKLEDLYGLDNSMYVYGTGDHGGGPTRRDIRRAKELDSYPTTPNVKFSTTHSFFDSLAGEDSPSITVEKGELNFVFDGCYTTHADIKKYNRKCENQLVNTEILAAIGSLTGMPYDKDKISQCWKVALFNQFHDILDGSGVKATYKYSSEIAEKALETLETLANKYITGIGSRIKTSGNGIPVILFNTTNWERDEYIKIQLPESLKGYSGAQDVKGVRLETQKSEGVLYVYVKNIPSMGYKMIYLDREANESEYDSIKEDSKSYYVETGYYRLEVIKASGEIIVLYDKINNKYVVNKGEPGWRARNGILDTLQIHYEMPAAMSAWEIGPASKIKNLVSDAISTIKVDGPLVKILSFRHQAGSSMISQDIVIYDKSPRIDFETTVEWNETGDYGKEAPMLKAVFTPDIDNRDASYEIPFGVVDRPCKDIEVPALKWADISDEDYGFSLLNDCKYGYKVKGNLMELTLIRSGWMPDAESDKGRHEFVYSIFPHKGDWVQSDTLKQGFFLNNPVIASFIEGNAGGNLPEEASFVKVSGRNVAISAFKTAEEGHGLVLRLFNNSRRPERVKVEFGFDSYEVNEVDLIERRHFGTIHPNGKGYEFDLGGFEIKTFLLLQD